MSVRRSILWMLASQGGLLVLQFGGSVALARLLTPYEMGVYAVAAAMIGIIGILQTFGLAQFVIREAEASHEMLASAFTMNILLALLLSGAIAALSVVGGITLNEPGVRNVMLVLAIIPLIGIFEFRPNAMIERNGQFRAIAALNILRAVSSTCVTLALAFTGHSYMSIAWGSVAGSTASAAGAMVMGRHHIGFRLNLGAWRAILRFGVQQIAIQGVNTIAYRCSEFLLGRLLGLEALGIWGRASNLNNLIGTNLHMIVGRVMMVKLADQHRAGHSLRTVYLRSVEVLTAVLWPTFAGLAILAGPFISVVYGPAWVGAAWPLAGLAAASIIAVSLSMTWEVFIICHETGRQARLEYYRTGIGLVLFAGGCLLNLTMASVSRIADSLVSQAIYRPHIERMTETSWSDYRTIYRVSALATVAACGPAAALMVTFRWSPDVPILLVGLSVVSGVGLWLVSLKLLDHPIAEEIGRFVSRGRRALGVT